MAETSGIEWTDSTFNPWIGCTKVSPACDHCYAAVSTPARALGVEWGAGQPRRRTSAANWKLPLRWDRLDGIKLRAWEQFKAQYPGLSDAGLEARGFIKPRRRRVFCASLADVFDNEVPAPWRWDLFQLIRGTPHIDWLLLTKRIGNAQKMLNAAASAVLDDFPGEASWDRAPWPNIWLGATICNQEEADRDIPKLLATPAAVRFLSMEPLLGPVDLMRSDYLTAKLGSYPFKGIHADGRTKLLHMLDWVIAGGESGPSARPMHPDWARSLRDQCKSAGVPFLFKQWGEWAPYARPGGYDWRLPPGKFVTWDSLTEHRPFHPNLHEGTASRRVGKKAAGRHLDGRLHNGFPEAT